MPVKTYSTKTLPPLPSLPVEELQARIRIRMALLNIRNKDIQAALGLKKSTLSQRLKNNSRRSIRWWSVILALPEEVLVGDTRTLAGFPSPPPGYLDRLVKDDLVGMNPTWQELSKSAWGHWLPVEG